VTGIAPLVTRLTIEGAAVNRKAVLAVSALLALVSVVLMQLYRQNVARELGVDGNTVEVVVASADLRAGVTLKRSDLKVVDFPARYAPPRALGPGFADELLGRRLEAAVRAEEPVTLLHMAGSGESVRLSDVIPRGHRALTVEIGKTAFTELVQPGDYVDVLLTIQDPKERSVETRTLLQAVAVLAVGSTTGQDPEVAARGGGGARRTTDVTLAVAPPEAEMLVLAQDQGILSMTMRMAGEIESTDTLDGWNLHDLLQREPVNRVQKARDLSNCVHITQAGEGGSTKCVE